jgi:hypothetical protein
MRGGDIPTPATGYPHITWPRNTTTIPSRSILKPERDSKRPPTMTGTYESASHYVHTTVVSIIPHLAKPREFFHTAKRDTEVSKALLALQYSLGYVLMTSTTVGRHLDELQAAATEDGGIVWHPRKLKS